jgi:hypothetical protein
LANDPADADISTPTLIELFLQFADRGVELGLAEGSGQFGQQHIHRGIAGRLIHRDAEHDVQGKLTGTGRQIRLVFHGVECGGFLQQGRVSKAFGVTLLLRLSFPERGNLLANFQAEKFGGGHGKKFFLQVQGKLDGFVQTGFLAAAEQAGDKLAKQLNLPEKVILALVGHGSGGFLGL